MRVLVVEDEPALLDMGDFVGGLLKYLRKHPVPRLTIAGARRQALRYGENPHQGAALYGVAPDLEVLDDPSLMAHGEDPQLVAGVQHLLRELESFAFERPRRPASPDRRGAGVTPADR